MSPESLTKARLKVVEGTAGELQEEVVGELTKAS
jgi:hypothetical protein